MLIFKIRLSARPHPFSISIFIRNFSRRNYCYYSSNDNNILHILCSHDIFHENFMLKITNKIYYFSLLKYLVLFYHNCKLLLRIEADCDKTLGTHSKNYDKLTLSIFLHSFTFLLSSMLYPCMNPYTLRVFDCSNTDWPEWLRFVLGAVAITTAVFKKARSVLANNQTDQDKDLIILVDFKGFEILAKSWIIFMTSEGHGHPFL